MAFKKGDPPVSKGDPPVSKGDPPVSKGDPPVAPTAGVNGSAGAVIGPVHWGIQIGGYNTHQSHGTRFRTGEDACSVLQAGDSSRSRDNDTAATRLGSVQARNTPCLLCVPN